MVNTSTMPHESRKRTLYVSDLDGTLLNGDSRISDTTRAILNDCIDKYGTMFTVATARTPATVVPLLKGVHINLPAIVMTGAAMWNLEEKGYRNVCTMPMAKIEQLHDICIANGINPFIYKRDGDMLSVYHHTDMTNKEREFISERQKSPFKHFSLHNDYHPGESIMLFAMAKYDKIKAVHSTITSMVDCEAVCYRDIYNHETGLLEVFETGSSKAAAIKRLATQVEAERIVVFGDNLNDISMMKIADHSVAMSNGVREAQNAASEIIGSNNEDSVARWIAHDIEAITIETIRY